MASLDMEDFVIRPVSGAIAPPEATTDLDSLKPLDLLRGTWRGRGFNQIWRPFNNGSQDRFLELNETTEVIQFVEIPGVIPNRGLLQNDITLRGLTYLQRISDINVKDNGKPTGIHIEPGIWVKIPPTINPADPGTVSRLANIPHGTSFVAQGSVSVGAGKPTIPPISITPFTIAPPNKPIPFPETNLSVPTPFRTPPQDIPNVIQPLVDNPNLLLADAIARQNITSTTTLQISTEDLNPPTSGGGTANIAFLQGAAAGPNAQAFRVDATFWIEEVLDGAGKPHLQLQYSQRVLLNFKGLSWPHVSVATLFKDR